MDINDFHKDFLEEVKATAAIAGEGSSVAFVNIAADYLINTEVLPDFIPAFYIGTGKNNRKIRVDGYVLEEFDYTMNLVIADYSGDIERDVLTKTNANVLFDRLAYFVEEAQGNKLLKEIEPSTPAYDLVQMLHIFKEKIRKFRLIILTDGFMSDRISTVSLKNINGTPVECQIWDVERIYKVCFSDIGRQNIEINFKAYSPKGIPCIVANGASTEEFNSYLCIIPGNTLANIYDFFGSQLLEGNVRSFLSTKVAVNKKIRETILKSPEKFFAYNNGISATAMDLVIDEAPEGKYIVYAKDFQIINGGQTTASLSNTRHKDNANLDNIYVQMKLTEINSNNEKVGELIRNISKSSNSQNKVSDADFFSTAPFHVRMEQISRRLFAPAVEGKQYETKWFYERARGQYLQAQMRMTKTEKTKFVTQNPKTQVITKTDLSKVRNTWNGLPQIVSRGAQTNFMKFAELTEEAWENSDALFNERYFKESAALIILFKHTENVVTHQSWYEKGYRANIVTYSLALLRRLIKKQFENKDLDLMIIWNKQSVPDIITNELIKITKEIYEKITASDRETVNVTQWCKRDACWNRIKDCELRLTPNVEKVLIDKNAEKRAVKEAKSDQKIVSDLEAQTKVIEYGADFWKKVNAFVSAKRIIVPDAMIAIKYAMQIPDTIPSGYQSIKLLELLKLAEDEGFK